MLCEGSGFSVIGFRGLGLGFRGLGFTCYMFEWVGGIFRCSAEIWKLKLLRYATPTWDAIPIR